MNSGYLGVLLQRVWYLERKPIFLMFPNDELHSNYGKYRCMCRDSISPLNLYHTVSVNFFPLLMLKSRSVFAKVISESKHL